MKRINVVFLVLCTFLVPAAWAQKITCPARVNWTEFLTIDMARYNPCETVLGVDNVGGLTLLWNHKTGGLVMDSPAIVNGVVYIASGSLFALKASTGAKLWEYTLQGDLVGRSRPAWRMGFCMSDRGTACCTA